MSSTDYFQNPFDVKYMIELHNLCLTQINDYAHSKWLAEIVNWLDHEHVQGYG